MATAARIESSLGFNDTEFVAGIRQAEQRAATFSARAGKSFENVFKRGPGRRAEQAIAGLVGDLSSGNVAGGITSLASRMTGFGLAAGVGIGVAVEAFAAFKRHIDETRSAQEKFQDLMSKPVEMIVSSGEADATIERLQENATKLHEKFGNFWEAVKNTYTGRAGLFNSASENKQASAESQEATAGFTRAQEIARERGAQHLALAGAQTNPTMQGRLIESMMKFDSEKAKATAAARDNPALGKGLRDELAAIEKRRRFVTDEIAERDEANQREFETAKKIFDLKRSGISPEAQERMGATMKGADIRATLAGHTLSDEARRSLELASQQQEDIANKPRLRRASWGSLAGQNDRNDASQGSLLRRGIEDSLGFGGLARRDLDAGLYKTPEEALLGTGTTSMNIRRYKSSEVQEQMGTGGITKADLESAFQSVMEKYWGGK
jgi:hypothetical protein